MNEGHKAARKFYFSGVCCLDLPAFNLEGRWRASAQVLASESSHACAPSRRIFSRFCIYHQFRLRPAASLLTPVAIAERATLRSIPIADIEDRAVDDELLAAVHVRNRR